MAAAPSKRALDKFDETFAKKYGAESIRVPTKRRYKTVSTGSMTLDYAMGCGGWIVGRVSEVWGPESVAKSTLGLIRVANWQKAFPSKLYGWIDMERTFDAEWAEKNGVDLKKLRVLRPSSAEDVSDMSRDMLSSGYFADVVLDSVGGMVTEEEMEKDAAKSAMGTAAQVTTRMVKQAAVLCDDNDCGLLIINQVRANMAYGADTQSSGAFALKHVTTHKIRLRKTATPLFTIGSKSAGTEEVVGMEIAAIVEKNKVAPPRRVATFALFNQATEEYGPVGIDRASEAFTMGVRYGIIAKPSQGYYVMPGEDEKDKIHGEAKTMARLRSDPAVLDLIRRSLLDKASAQVRDVVEDEVPNSEGENTALEFVTGDPAEMVDA